MIPKSPQRKEMIQNLKEKQTILGQILAGWPLWKAQTASGEFWKGKTAKFKG